MAFKADSDDPRESLSYKLRNLLQIEAKRGSLHGPLRQGPDLVPLETAIAQADVVILGVPHSVYRELQIPPEKIVDRHVEFLELSAESATRTSRCHPIAQVS